MRKGQVREQLPWKMEKIIEKAMNLVAKKNSMDPGNCISFPFISDSNTVTRIANLGVSMGRDSSVMSSVTSLKNIEIDRLKVSAKNISGSNRSSSPKINLDEEEEDLLDAQLSQICENFNECARGGT